MIRTCVLLLLVAAGVAAQSPEMSDEEQQHLRQVLSQGSSSPEDFMRALESHLSKYPNSPRKADIEQGIAKSAIQAKDQHRIAVYGARVLTRDPDDVALLDPVCRALLVERTEPQTKAALELSKHFETYVRTLIKEMPADTADRGRQRDDLDRMLGHALLYQAMAAGMLGDSKASVELARRSFDAYPSGDAMVELGKRLAQLGKTEEAIVAYADAFSIADPHASESDRAEIRRRAGELYQKLKGTEVGLGDLILQSYDKTSALLAERRLKLKQFDPNLGLSNPMEFTLNGVNGEKLALSSLLGKVVILDFWATWCGPCRGQHPLYEEVKKRFQSNASVVFLSINSDEDASDVKPFLEAQGWKNPVYYEGGLNRVLRVSSMPTTVVFGKNGSVVSRMNGYDPKSFVDALTERIKSALAGSGVQDGQ